MLIKSILVASFLLTSLASNAIAGQPDLQNDPALRIESVSVVEVEALALPIENRVELPTTPGNPIGEITMIVDGLIALGKKIWPIIDAGRPVINNKLIPAISILPHLDNPAGVMTQMANWSVPVTRSYRVSFKNGFNSEVVGFTYTVYFQYNGNLNGVGKYVTSLKVQASQIYAAWGFNFDAVSELVGIANVGSAADPVASGIIQVAYTVRGLLNESRSAQSFYVDGNGNIQVLNN